MLGDTGSGVAYLDMGWPDGMVAVEYDGEQHRSNRSQYSWDVRRLEIVQRRGWIVVRVLAGDQPPDILRRVGAARALRRECCSARREGNFTLADEGDGSFTHSRRRGTAAAGGAGERPAQFPTVSPTF